MQCRQRHPLQRDLHRSHHIVVPLLVDIDLYLGKRLQSLNPTSNLHPPTPVDLAVLHQPLAAINVGLESFTESLMAQGAPVIQVDWQPPAGGNEKLMALLERMRQKDEGQ